MCSLFLRTFLLFWLTVLLAGTALIVIARQTGPDPGLRESLFTNVLPAEAQNAARIYEAEGMTVLDRRFTKLETKYPLQIFLFDDAGLELRGRGAPDRARDMARLIAVQDVSYAIVNLAGRRTVGPSGRTYALIFLQEPSLRYRLESQGTMKRLLGLVLPIVVLIAAGLFCYLTARHVTRPVLGLRTAAAGIAEGHLSTRVDPRWKRRRDEIGELSRDFDRMAARIESLVAGQKRLLGDVSHELRSPLSRLMVALELVKSRPAEEAPELIGRIGFEARRLDKLIGQLLTLARIDSGMHAAAEPFDLASVVEEVARDAGFEARAVGRGVVANGVPCSVTGSEELIRSAVENVVRNAVRHTAEGTRVEIALERRGETAVITLRDHGPGVPEAHLTEMFVPFRRVKGSPGGGAGDGSGLGLAIADRALKLHGGSIRAENPPGGGLLVTIEIPCSAPR